jgi:hypothetical protein
VRANIKYEQQGFIGPALSPWGAPVLFQRKKNGKLRMCIDYRALSHQTIKHAFPMPRIEEFRDHLRCGRWLQPGAWAHVNTIT